MNLKYILFLILGIDVFVLSLKTSELSISYLEALIIYGDTSFLKILLDISFHFFGENDFALRLPMIMMHIFSILLLYSISKKYLKYERDRLWLVFIFVLLPGVISSSIIVNSAGLLIFGLLLFMYIYGNYSIKHSYVLLFIFSIIESSFVYLFISLIVYSYTIKNKRFLLFNFMMLVLSVYLYGFNSHGLPKGYFLDAFGLYATVFTPMIFIYLFYVLYKRLLKKEIDILWYISSITLLISLILSFRQRIDVAIFAPYLIIALPLVVQTFSSSYRVRLKIFRTKYKIFFIFTLVFLFLNSFLLFFNKEIYRFIQNPKKHFAYKMHVAKELSQELKYRGIECIDSPQNISFRLRFYGINKCEKYKLDIVNDKENENIVTISYRNKDIYRASVTKINTQ